MIFFLNFVKVIFEEILKKCDIVEAHAQKVCGATTLLLYLLL